MRHIGVRFGMAVAGVAIWAFSAQGAFEDPLWSARSAALGGAFTTIGDDPTAAFYNPAAAASVRPRGANFGYAKLFTGVDEVDLSMNQLAYVQPLMDRAILTAGWGSVVAGDLHREDTFTIGAAQHYENVPLMGALSAGLSLRYLSQSYKLDQRSSSDPVFQEGSSRGVMALDVHAHKPAFESLFRGFSAGLSLRGINEPNVGLRDTVRLPMEIALGFQYQWKNWNLPLDLVHRKDKLTPQLGVEGRFVENRLAVRGGTDTHQAGAGMGYTHPLGKTLLLKVDYTFLWPLEIESTSGSHRATVGLEF